MPLHRLGPGENQPHSRSSGSPAGRPRWLGPARHETDRGSGNERSIVQNARPPPGQVARHPGWCRGSTAPRFRPACRSGLVRPARRAGHADAERSPAVHRPARARSCLLRGCGGHRGCRLPECKRQNRLSPVAVCALSLQGSRRFVACILGPAADRFEHAWCGDVGPWAGLLKSGGISFSHAQDCHPWQVKSGRVAGV